MSKELTIRAASPADIPAITAIYAEQVRHGTASWEYDPPDEAEMARRMAGLVDAGYPYLACEVGGELAGYAYAGPFRPRAAYRFTVENSIYVGPAARGRGVGRALLAALIGAAEARGYRQMIAVIGDSRNAASIRLHEALGFRLVGVFRSIGYKQGQWLDGVWMQRPLGPGDATPP